MRHFVLTFFPGPARSRRKLDLAGNGAKVASDRQVTQPKRMSLWKEADQML